MEARNKTIEEWFALIRQGAIVLPRFQRHEAWSFAQVEAVLENILRRPALPLGALLTLEVGDDAPFFTRPIVGAPNAARRPSLNLLDGQQRMTALWRSLTGSYPDADFFVEPFPGSDNEARPPVSATPPVHMVRRTIKNGIRYPVWADQPAEIWRRGWLPINLLAPGAAAEQALDGWVDTAATGDQRAERDIHRAATELRQRVASFVIPFLSLPLGTDRDTALDVFIKMNTQNTPLSALDIVVAQIEAAANASLHEMVDDIKREVPRLAAYADVGEVALAVGATLMGTPPNRASYLHPDFGPRLIEHWSAIQTGLKRGVSFLSEESIHDGQRLPSDTVLTLICALWAHAPEGRDGEGRARRLIRKALWVGCFSDRYQKTSATRVATDVRQLSALISGADTLCDLFDPLLTPLPQPEELVLGGWPKTKDRLGRAILAASLRAGGIDFADAAPVTPESLSRREYHHIFPTAFLGEHVERRRVLSALNCALVSWKTNRTIGANPPSIYLQDRAEAVGTDWPEIRRRLESHLIPVDELMSDNFDAFLNARTLRITDAMRRLCEGDPV